MMKHSVHIVLVLLLGLSASAQNSSKLMREGLLDYKQGNFDQAITKYKQALKKDADKNLANYNIGTAYYKAGKPDSAMMYWQSVATTDKDKELQARSWHNIGNSFVKQKNFEKAVDAYKRSLKLNPNDEDTRYNLAYSQRVLQQQQQQQQQQKQQQDKEKEKEKEQEQDQDKEEEKKDDMDKDNAEKILQALDNKEKNLHKKKIKGEPASPTKDW